MCLYEMGIPAISPSSESTFIPQTFIDALKRRFKRILVCFDRDGPGVSYLRKISLKTGLEPMLVHKKFKAKDISDAIKLNGFETIKSWIYDKVITKHNYVPSIPSTSRDICINIGNKNTV